MDDVLIVLNPRRIHVCLDAICELPISKLWLRNMSELEIQERWDEVLYHLNQFDRAFIISDDAIPRPHALAQVRETREDVVTGYSNLSADDMRVNLTKTPISERISKDSYDLYTLKEVMEHPLALVPTYFTGFCLTGMSVDMWRRYPYQVETDGADNMAGDYNLSKRLNRDDVRMWAHRDAFVWHVKERWSELDVDPAKRLLVGIEPTDITLEHRR